MCLQNVSENRVPSPPHRCAASLDATYLIGNEIFRTHETRRLWKMQKEGNVKIKEEVSSGQSTKEKKTLINNSDRYNELPVILPGLCGCLCYQAKQVFIKELLLDFYQKVRDTPKS